MDRIRVMLADDNPNVVRLLTDFLSRKGEIELVAAVTDGAAIVDTVCECAPDVLIMDIIMPRRDGFMVLEELSRLEGVKKPKVIVLTGLGRDDFVIRALRLGASYYMVKPFDTKEVVARIKAVLRRCTVTTSQTESSEGVIEFDNLRLDMNSYELRVKGKVVEAPPKELELLNCLASHPNRLHPRPAAGRGVGLRVLRRQPHHRRPCQAPAREAGRCFR